MASRLLAVAADRAASHTERLLIRLLRAAQITGWRLGYPVHGYLIDVAFPAQRVDHPAAGQDLAYRWG
ncbi:MAG TPA: hypothetical protein VNA67_02255 [Pseudonocardiaceae bacterium]|nr:hypothetical protein [Pseudonocardiaceae bacterium]